MVYLRPDLFIPKEAITTKHDVDRWPHLADMQIPSIKKDIGLLISSDVLKAFELLEVRRSDNGGSYGVCEVGAVSKISDFQPEGPEFNPRPGQGLNFGRPSFTTPPVDGDIKPLV